jgi:membrane-associated protein
VTDDLLALVPLYGAAFLFLSTFFACLAAPFPASLAMLAGGAFASVGDLELLPIVSAAWAGAVFGDQAGFFIGRIGGPIFARLGDRPKTGKLLTQASGKLQENGWLAVFFTRCLFSPLGPWVNFAAGATGIRWSLFSSASLAGESVWVLTYVGLGWGFAAQIDSLGETMGSALGALTAGIVAVLLGRMLWRLSKNRNLEQDAVVTRDIAD